MITNRIFRSPFAGGGTGGGGTGPTGPTGPAEPTDGTYTNVGPGGDGYIPPYDHYGWIHIGDGLIVPRVKDCQEIIAYKPGNLAQPAWKRTGSPGHAPGEFATYQTICATSEGHLFCYRIRCQVDTYQARAFGMPPYQRSQFPVRTEFSVTPGPGPYPESPIHSDPIYWTARYVSEKAFEWVLLDYKTGLDLFVKEDKHWNNKTFSHYKGLGRKDRFEHTFYEYHDEVGIYGNAGYIPAGYFFTGESYQDNEHGPGGGWEVWYQDFIPLNPGTSDGGPGYFVAVDGGGTEEHRVQWIGTDSLGLFEVPGIAYTPYSFQRDSACGAGKIIQWAWLFGIGDIVPKDSDPIPKLRALDEKDLKVLWTVELIFPENAASLRCLWVSDTQICLMFLSTTDATSSNPVGHTWLRLYTMKDGTFVSEMEILPGGSVEGNNGSHYGVGSQLMLGIEQFDGGYKTHFIA